MAGAHEKRKGRYRSVCRAAKEEYWTDWNWHSIGKRRMCGNSGTAVWLRGTAGGHASGKKTSDKRGEKEGGPAK